MFQKTISKLTGEEINFFFQKVNFILLLLSLLLVVLVISVVEEFSNDLPFV